MPPYEVEALTKRVDSKSLLAIDRPNSIKRNDLTVCVIMANIIDNSKLAFHHLEASRPPAVRLAVRCSRQYLHSAMQC